MLNKLTNTTRTNILLSITIIVFSFYTILWHNQSYLLYVKAKRVQKENQKIMALYKQLLIEHSSQISGKSIKEESLKVLHMKRPDKIMRLIL